MKSSFFTEIKRDLIDVENFLEEYIDFDHPELRKSSQHILKAGGKRIRPAFVLLSGKIYNKTSIDNLIPFAAAIELIHMASLVHDDVIDKADLRRGQPTIRVLWGNKFSLHCGDYLLAQAVKLIEPEKNQEIAKVLSRISIDMCQGEIEQLLSAFDPNQSIKDYFYRIKRKTALLIAASCKIGAIASNAPLEAVDALYKYGYYLGMAFQIKDDVLDMQGDSTVIGKPAGSDLAQGIITLPTIITLSNFNQDSIKLRNLIIDKFANNDHGLTEALEIIEKNGSLEKSLLLATKFIKKAKDQLEVIPNCSTKKNLRKIADYVNERDF